MLLLGKKARYLNQLRDREQRQERYIQMFPRGQAPQEEIDKLLHLRRTIHLVNAIPFIHYDEYIHNNRHLLPPDIEIRPEIPDPREERDNIPAHVTPISTRRLLPGLPPPRRLPPVNRIPVIPPIQSVNVQPELQTNYQRGSYLPPIEVHAIEELNNTGNGLNRIIKRHVILKKNMVM